jgi:dephospho-CoA kinase
MRVIITGPPMSGKTTLLNKLEDRGIKIFNSDKFVHSIYLKGNPGYDAIKDQFGDTFVNETEVDRRALADYIIKNKDSLKKLNEIIHPFVVEEINKYENLIIEAPIANKNLFYYDNIIQLTANKEVLIKRLNSLSKDASYDFLSMLIDK